MKSHFDLEAARRIANELEGHATAARSWAQIVQGRMHSPKPIDDIAKGVGRCMCAELTTATDELRRSADALLHLLHTA
jgi:hypothetical protein